MQERDNIDCSGAADMNTPNVVQDFLYIGDGSDNTVKRFDVSGNFLGTFVVPGDGGLNGPRGLLFDHESNLLVSNQNVDSGRNGSILKYSGNTGAFLGELVRFNGKNAPFAPRGIVLSEANVLFVADLIGKNNKKPGELRTYDGSAGTFLGNLDHSGFSGPFYPRGVVIGPDGLLYVSVFNIFNPSDGWVLRFDPVTGEYKGIFVGSSVFNDLHRPEGLVFGPNGNLYVTSFRKDTHDTDKILVFDRNTGMQVDKIDLYNVGQLRAFAQAILFGPDGKLFVPITGDGPDQGSVRRYDVLSKTFDVIVPPASEDGPLGEPWYLTFGNTNPATLEYLG
ncbi:hypothetical protein [Neobacillus sp. SAB-20_R2A]|uniref:hypothetical protein n=1 Tax=Neobacillus sp. SAB-20_R2A TaxID=3120519 RepID=UPI003C6E1FB0